MLKSDAAQTDHAVQIDPGLSASGTPTSSVALSGAAVPGKVFLPSASRVRTA